MKTSTKENAIAVGMLTVGALAVLAVFVLFCWLFVLFCWFLAFLIDGLGWMAQT